MRRLLTIPNTSFRVGPSEAIAPLAYRVADRPEAGIICQAMKHVSLKAFIVVLVFSFSFAATNRAGSPLVTIETVPVGDAGNASNENGLGSFGSVALEFRMGAHEITIAQYTTFLNSVASVTDSDQILNLWHPAMATNLNIAGIGRSGAGTSEDPFVYAAIGNSNRPIAYISWFDAARFANWLHNGATNGASTETGAYSLNGETQSLVAVNPDALWYIPALNEWYKAAFYKSAGTNAGYHFYPTRSDFSPGNVVGGTTNQANYRAYSGQGWTFPFSVTQSDVYDEQQNYLTEVGAFSGSPSPHGTFDQAGNLGEWVTIEPGRDWWATAGGAGVAGGNWADFGGLINSVTNTITFAPSFETETTGFRLAAPGPDLVVTTSSGVRISNDQAATPFENVLVGAVSTNRNFVIRNNRNFPLTGVSLLKQGLHTSAFSVSPSWISDLQPGASAAVSISFAPTSGGEKVAKLAIVHSGSDTNLFVMNLRGIGLSDADDTDGDGLNDAAEFSMSAIGFDWQKPQSELVSDFFNTTIRTGVYTSNNVVANAASLGLYTKDQYDANRAAGRSDVLSNPGSYGLFTSNSIMDLRMGGLMIQKQGSNATVVFQPQTTMDLMSQPFVDHGIPITNTIPMPGNRGFIRIQAR